MTKTISFDGIAQADVHRYLLSAVAPRPICFASTTDSEGNVNLSPFSFFNVFSSNPPVLIFSPARSGRTNTTKDTYKNVLEVDEVVVNIVNYPMVEQMSLASTAYERGVNEFKKAGFTEVPSDEVRPPRVGEAPVAFECKVQQVIELGTEGGAGNLVIAKVLRMHVQEAYLNSEGYLDTKKLDLVARMGGNWYCRANGKALFEIPKPIRSKGIGVDMLPKHVRESTILTGNDLGRLGNTESLPSKEYLVELTKEQSVRELLERKKRGVRVTVQDWHRLAKTYLEQGKIDAAIGVLLQDVGAEPI